MIKILEFVAPIENNGEIFYFDKPIVFKKDESMKIINETKNKETHVCVFVDK